MATIHLLGNSHIDAVWLWTKDETLKVCEETFSKVLDLMDKYPSLTFCQSAAQYYEWIEKHRPDLFERIKAKVREGRWEVVGGAWVESDTNLPSGESLVRQMLYGKRYFLEKFGIDVKIGWLPDTFGFCWTLPQILAKSGVKYFLTQKLRWNDTTVFPYNVFWWQSPDGSKVLSHQTLGSYNESLESWEEIERQLLILRLRHGIEELIVLFGYGDHGGGLSEGHVERALKWINEHTSGNRVVKFSTAAEYFSTLEGLAQSTNAPVVDDELYLQFHRGTYTTQAEIKKWNRRVEALIENAEKLAVFAESYGFKYPLEELREAWKTLLFYQFHDAICGSSIKEVYIDAQRDYENLAKNLSQTIDRALEAIAKQVNTSGTGVPLLVFNTQSWTRKGIVALDASNLKDVEKLGIRDPQGKPTPSQLVRDGDARRLIFVAEDVPPMGFKEYQLFSTNGERPTQTSLSVKEFQDKITLENEYLFAEIDRKTGLISSLEHKTTAWKVIDPREPIAIHIFEDKPAAARKAIEGGFEAILFDAWEVYIFDQPDGVKSHRLDKPLSVEVLERGPVRAVVSSKYKYSQEGRPDSEITVKAILYNGTPILYLEITLDWRAQHKLAKLSIPTTINSEHTCYEIPYGHIYRRTPCSKNATTAERAKHEVAGQRWVDITSEKEGFGVSVLNDCKYGFDATQNEIRVTLIRSPSYPPPWPAGGIDRWLAGGEPTDQGRHTVTIGIYPHRGDWREAQTIKKAIELNNPLLVRIEEKHDGPLPKTYSFLSTDNENTLITAVKLAENGREIVIRLYEPHGRQATTTLKLPPKIKEAHEADLLEKPIKPLTTQNNQLKITLTPNEIKTILLKK